MKTAKARRSALIEAGFSKESWPGEVQLDVHAVASEADISVGSVYGWIKGTAGKFVNAMILQAIEQRERRAS